MYSDRLRHKFFIRHWRAVSLALGITTLSTGCYVLRPSAGGGQSTFHPPRVTSPADIALPEGYRITAVATGLTFPSAVTFDGSGRPCLLEAGYSYGETWATPRLLRLESDGTMRVLAQGGRNGPWSGVAYHEGSFYIAEGGELEGGRILKVTPGQRPRVLLSGLPSRGDHHTNSPLIGPDGALYFGQGTATNSGVVGKDNAQFGWLRRYPHFKDIPGRDIVLSGENFETREDGRRVLTGAYKPYGSPSVPGEVIPGKVLCNGAIVRLPLAGGRPQLVAWGFRNPFGLGFSPEGELYATDNGYDERGSRPIFGAGDLFWRVRTGGWHGWPDFSGDLPLAQNHFSPPGKARPRSLLATPPGVPPHPAAVLGVHSSACGFDFSRNSHFGHRGEAFIALFGDQAPTAGKVLHPVGFKLVRVDPKTGVIEDFATNKGRVNAPASATRRGGLERPVAARFDPSGNALYVVDFGVLTQSQRGSHPYPGTGVLWKITKESK